MYNLAASVALELVEATEAAVEAATSLPPSEARALTALANVAHGRSIEELRKVVRLSQPGCARLVDRLEEGGYATRTRPDDDRRLVLVYLTRRGRAVVRRILVARAQAMDGRLGALSVTDRSDLERVLARVADASINEPGDSNHFCRQCDAVACGHPDRCPSTQAALRLAGRLDEG